MPIAQKPAKDVQEAKSIRLDGVSRAMVNFCYGPLGFGL